MVTIIRWWIGDGISGRVAWDGRLAIVSRSAMDGRLTWNGRLARNAVYVRIAWNGIDVVIRWYDYNSVASRIDIAISDTVNGSDIVDTVCGCDKVSMDDVVVRIIDR